MQQLKTKKAGGKKGKQKGQSRKKTTKSLILKVALRLSDVLLSFEQLNDFLTSLKLLLDCSWLLYWNWYSSTLSWFVITSTFTIIFCPLLPDIPQISQARSVTSSGFEFLFTSFTFHVRSTANPTRRDVRTTVGGRWTWRHDYYSIETFRATPIINKL